MAAATLVQVWTLRVEGFDEAAVAPWSAMLDAGERERAGRFVFARHRVLFVAAHALMLAALDEKLRPAGFLRLWTLKEAFIKATGKGLTQNLASFWFDPCPPRIHLMPPLAEQEGDWRFEQRILDDGFVAALGLRHPAGN